MRDGVGCKIKEGDHVLWRSTGLVCRVVRVDDALLSTARGDRPDGRIVLEFGIPLPTEKLRYDQEIQLPDMLCLRDPRSDKLIDDLTGKPTQ